MTFRTLLTAFAIASCSLFGMAGGKSKALQEHNRIHRQHLANAKSGMDKSVIADILKKDISIREEKQENQLSKESASMIGDLLKEARRHMGKPYRHGSKGPSAFDCSGFSSYVYKQFGYDISPSSKAQFLQGEKVDRKNLRSGDLVFFTSRSSRGAVGHVGIVVSADNNTGDFKFIHASIKGVKISDFAGYYVGRYLGARRIITH